MTFNHGVEGSSPSALTNEINYLAEFPFHLGIVLWAVCGQIDCRGSRV